MKKLALACCLALVPGAALAQPADGYSPGNAPGRRFELTPHVSYRFGGDLNVRSSDDFPNNVELDDGVAYGATLEIPLGGSFQLELYFDHQDADVVSDRGIFDPDRTLAELGVTYGHVGMLFNFGDSRLSPFFVTSAGVTHLDPKVSGAGSDTKFSFGLGGGVKAFLAENIGLRLEGRYFWTYLDSYDSGGCYGGCYDYYDHYDTDYLSQWQASLGLIFAW